MESKYYRLDVCSAYSIIVMRYSWCEHTFKRKSKSSTSRRLSAHLRKYSIGVRNILWRLFWKIFSQFISNPPQLSLSFAFREMGKCPLQSPFSDCSLHSACARTALSARSNTSLTRTVAVTGFPNGYCLLFPQLLCRHKH